MQEGVHRFWRVEVLVAQPLVGEFLPGASPGLDVAAKLRLSRVLFDQGEKRFRPLKRRRVARGGGPLSEAVNRKSLGVNLLPV